MLRLPRQLFRTLANRSPLPEDPTDFQGNNDTFIVRYDSRRVVRGGASGRHGAPVDIAADRPHKLPGLAQSEALRFGDTPINENRRASVCASRRLGSRQANGARVLLKESWFGVRRATGPRLGIPSGGIRLMNAIGVAAQVLDSQAFFPTGRICSADTSHPDDARKSAYPCPRINPDGRRDPVGRLSRAARNYARRPHFLPSGCRRSRCHESMPGRQPPRASSNVRKKCDD